MSILLEKIDAPNMTILNKLVGDITENAKDLGLDASFAKRMAMPVQIISKKNNGGNQNIIYKNKAGHIISISKDRGVRIKSA